MAEPKRAPTTDTKTLTIKINQAFDCQPRHGGVDNAGEVYFDVDNSLTDGCQVHTSPSSAFENEASGGYIPLGPGLNGPFTPAVVDQTITYCSCATKGTCDPFKPTEQGGNTIGVGDTGQGHRSE